MNNYSRYLTFRVDPQLSVEIKRHLEGLFSSFPNAHHETFSVSKEPETLGRLVVDIYSEHSIGQCQILSTFKICFLDKNQSLFSYGQNIDQSLVDIILDESIDPIMLQKILFPRLESLVSVYEEKMLALGFKNIKKIETTLKQETMKFISANKILTSGDLLDYTQALVDLEKELIQTNDLSKFNKILKTFLKNYVEKTKVEFVRAEDLIELQLTTNFLPLPRYHGEFVALEMAWFDQDYVRLIKKVFFYYTLLNYFLTKRDIPDPFYDDSLWEHILDSIPFPVALLSVSGEIFQHNSLFSKLNLTPMECLNYKLREKILVHDIPYNVFRKDLNHLGVEKLLFVFFTESFFLKGDGQLTPSGQELGIISSSIAHELNNPIAGIQAAIGLLMLDENMNEEAKLTLVEMKNGANRCKQLIETFLGFSRANPKHLTVKDSQQSSIDICYQQAQNLLRFRTVESGIRFSMNFSRHLEFRAGVNLSLLTMTFYLILGELMTLYSHQLLIADKNQIEKVIRGEIIESSQEIQIQLHELNISTLSLSKLIQNLLTIENLVLQVTDYSLRFIYNPPKDAM